MISQFLMVRAATKTFAVPVTQVVEVLSAVQPETIIDQPASIEGLINLRGEIVAIHSLRIVAGLETREIEPSDKILILNNGVVKVGLITDEVETVQSFREEQLFAQSLTPNAFEIITVEEANVSLKSLTTFMDEIS